MSKEKFKGGLADGKSIQDIVTHHGKESWASIQFESLEKIVNRNLEKGIKIEKEHTDDESQAREIAMDHLWEDPKYYDKLEKIEESKKLIARLIKEEIDLLITDESPDAIEVLVKYNQRNAGVISVTPANAENTMEIVGVQFREEYDNLFIIKEAIQALWYEFKEINTFIVAPKLESVQYWNKLGFSRISPNYLISNRGH